MNNEKKSAMPIIRSSPYPSIRFSSGGGLTSSGGWTIGPSSATTYYSTGQEQYEYTISYDTGHTYRLLLKDGVLASSDFPQLAIPQRVLEDLLTWSAANQQNDEGAAYFIKNAI